MEGIQSVYVCSIKAAGAGKVGRAAILSNRFTQVSSASDETAVAWSSSRSTDSMPEHAQRSIVRGVDMPPVYSCVDRTLRLLVRVGVRPCVPGNDGNKTVSSGRT